jgi:carbon-monoxide dehydrogenase large subunit
MDVTDVSFDARKACSARPGRTSSSPSGSGGKGARRGAAELTEGLEMHETLRAGPIPTAAMSPRSRSTARPGTRRSCATPSVDDFGNLMNPMLAEGQVHGGVAQGIGQAITERVVYDEDGQLLTATFMDYAMPRADDTPFVAFHTEPCPRS